MPPVPFIRETTGGILLSVKLQPRANKNEIGRALGDELKIKVTALPVDAAANQALIELLAEKLRCARGQVELVRGHTARHKTVLLRGFALGKIHRTRNGGIVFPRRHVRSGSAGCLDSTLSSRNGIFNH